MVDVDLDAPDLDVDEEAGSFKRLVALAVVLITLLGAIVAYVQAVESNIEDVAARDAQRDAIRGLGDQVDASTALATELRIGTDIDAILQREALNAARVDALGGDAEADLSEASRQRLAAVAEAVADLTSIDPADPATVGALFAELERDPDTARLRQFVEADRANDHGGRADAYVTILTVLAVALFLLGLSLTVQGRSRYILAAPGVAIAMVCVGWAVIVSSRDITRVSGNAIEAVAEGRSLEQAGDLEGAIDLYTDAIRDSPDFAAAYARRASARFVQGSPQTGQTVFLSITSEEALDDALEDLETALELGADSDIITVAEAGFFTFLDRDFDRSARLSRQALDLNSSLAQVWFNLGVAEVAQDNEDEALESYEEGFEQLELETPGARQAVLAGARTDLSLLRDLLDSDDLDDIEPLIETVEARLAEFELLGLVCADPDEPCPADIDGGDAELGEVTFLREGALISASTVVEGLAGGDTLGAAWYFRTAEDLPFEQAAFSFEAVPLADDGFAFTSTIPVAAPACPVAGDYLVRFYGGGEFLGEFEESFEPSVLGDSFTLLADRVEGFEACQPEGFVVQEAPVNDLDAFTTMINEEGTLGIGVNVTPGGFALDLDIDPLDFAGQVALSGFPSDHPLEPATFQARDQDGAFIFLDGQAAIGPFGGFQTAVAVAAGPDASTRTVQVFAEPNRSDEEMRELLLEALGTITFTGVDTSGV